MNWELMDTCAAYSAFVLALYAVIRIHLKKTEPGTLLKKTEPETLTTKKK